jgi:hypothetical protein
MSNPLKPKHGLNGPPNWLLPVERNCRSSASLGMTKGREVFPFKAVVRLTEPQVPPLRYAPVGMTNLF